MPPRRIITPATLPPSLVEALDILDKLDRLTKRPPPTIEHFERRVGEQYARCRKIDIPDREIAREIERMFRVLHSYAGSARHARHLLRIAVRHQKHPLFGVWKTGVLRTLDSLIDSPAIPLCGVLSAMSMAHDATTPEQLAALTEGTVTSHFIPHA